MKFFRNIIRELVEEIDEILDLFIDEEKEEKVNQMPLLLSKKKSYFNVENKKAA